MQRSSLKNNATFRTLDLGCLSYADARAYIRNELHPVVKSSHHVVIVFAAHEPVLTLGKRFVCEDLPASLLAVMKERNVSILETDRGGKLTFHSPEQLMVYPVMDLRSHALSVKSYVNFVLGCISRVCNELGVETYVDRDLQGVWTKKDQKKIAAAGFRILGGLSEHGVAVYVGELNREFSLFEPCGMSFKCLTSFSQELGESYNFAKIRSSFLSMFPKYLETDINSRKLV